MVEAGVDKYECTNGKLKRAGNRKGKCDKGEKRELKQRRGRGVDRVARCALVRGCQKGLHVPQPKREADMSYGSENSYGVNKFTEKKN